MPEETSLKPVLIHVDTDADARRISAVLRALGYEVERSRDLAKVSADEQKAAAIARLVSRHKLTSREGQILPLIVAGKLLAEIGRELEISRATVKWHTHNIYAKTDTTNTGDITRLVMDAAFKGV